MRPGLGPLSTCPEGANINFGSQCHNVLDLCMCVYVPSAAIFFKGLFPLASLSENGSFGPQTPCHHHHQQHKKKFPTEDKKIFEDKNSIKNLTRQNFTGWAHRPQKNTIFFSRVWNFHWIGPKVDSVIESRCPCVCLCVCDVAKLPLEEVVETSGQWKYS